MLSLMHLIHHVVHMYIKKKNYKKIKLNYKKGKKQRPFGLGALGHQVISVHFQPKKKKTFAPGALGLLSNLFLKTFLLFLQRIQIFSKAFFSKEHKKIHLTNLLPNHDD